MKKYLLRPFHLYRRNQSFRTFRKQCETAGKPLGLHMGCGDRPIHGWFNCDVARITGRVHYVDATLRLPFEDASFDFVFTEHFIEHLSLEQGTAFFNEAFRILKPTGVLRTATPSLRFVRDLYDRKTPDHVRYLEWCVSRFLPGRPVTPGSVINHLFYGWGHRFIYDPEMLAGVLGKIGFRQFQEYKPGESGLPGLSKLEQHGNSVPPEFNDLETLVLEATK